MLVYKLFFLGKKENLGKERTAKRKNCKKKKPWKRKNWKMEKKEVWKTLEKTREIEDGKERTREKERT